ncbi:MAG: ABC transporter permease [Anaerolineaceae bacterium]
MKLKEISQNWRAMMMVAEMTFRMQITDSFIIFVILIQPLAIAVLGLWMLKDKGLDIGMFVIVGSGMTGLWSSLLFISGGNINFERWVGTLEILVGVPTPFELIVYGKNIASVAQSLVSMITAYLLAALLFGYSLSIQQPLLFVLSLILTVFAFISFGLLIAPIFVINPTIENFINGLEFPVYILSGFLFPIALLPGWTTPLSYLLPPYWAAVALHGTSTGNAPLTEILSAWGMMLLFSLVDFFIARQLFKIMLHKVRVDATLRME